MRADAVAIAAFQMIGARRRTHPVADPARNLHPSWIALATMLALACLPAAVHAKDMPVKLLHSWTGRIPLVVQPPTQSSIGTSDALTRVWAQCQVKEAMPRIDFDRQLVLLAVRRGSSVKFRDLKLDDGNLKTSVVVTPDMPPHLTCAIVMIDRTGVTKVNGMPVGQ